MRTIKFRAWDSKYKKMCVGATDGWDAYRLVLIDEGLRWIDQNGQLFANDRLKDIVVMQFTGLHDKNGKEIHEGDVVKSRLMDDEIIGVVRYSDKWATFYLAITNKHGVAIALDSVYGWHYDVDADGPSDEVLSEVVGNIYETPELVQ